MTSGDLQWLDTYSPIGHVLKILSPLLEGLLLSGGGRQPLCATNEPDRDGHHLLDCKIKFICELTPIRQIEDWWSHEKPVVFMGYFID